MSVREKIASIVPLEHLEATRDDRYFMALSFAMDNTRYTSFFADRVAEGKYVILDNSTVELGEPEDFTVYLGKAMTIDASEIVLPDYLYKTAKTLDAVDWAIWAAEKAGYKGNLMAVPQGETVEQWLGCAFAMLSKPIHTLGISRRYTQMFGGTREGIVQRLIPALGRVKIHLLGCAGDPVGDGAELLRRSSVRGIDSSIASIFTSCSMTYSPSEPRPAAGIDVRYDRYAGGLLKENLERWKARCEDG